jgi:hypothetical protein
MGAKLISLTELAADHLVKGSDDFKIRRVCKGTHTEKHSCESVSFLA